MAKNHQPDSDFHDEFHMTSWFCTLVQATKLWVKFCRFETFGFSFLRILGVHPKPLMTVVVGGVDGGVDSPQTV